MASIINGTNIILYYYDTTTHTAVQFAAATSCSFNVNVDTLDVSSQSSAWFKEFKINTTSWDISADGFITLSNDYNYAFLLQLVLNKTPITVKFSIDNDNGDGSHTLGYTIITGNCILTSVSISGSVESAATYSVSLQGTGGYSIDGVVVTPSSILIGSQVVKMYDYTATGGETSITFSGAIGFTCFSVTRGGVEVHQIITSGIPTALQVKWNTTTGVLTFGTALGAGEFVRALFK